MDQATSMIATFIYTISDIIAGVFAICCVLILSGLGIYYYIGMLLNYLKRKFKKKT